MCFLRPPYCAAATTTMGQNGCWGESGAADCLKGHNQEEAVCHQTPQNYGQAAGTCRTLAREQFNPLLGILPLILAFTVCQQYPRPWKPIFCQLYGFSHQKELSNELFFSCYICVRFRKHGKNFNEIRDKRAKLSGAVNPYGKTALPTY